jgi:hypothetical protein
MKLEDQVCSLENSKKLDELGVKVESYFTWLSDPIRGDRVQMRGLMADSVSPAYTVAELGEMLPDEIAGYRENNLWVSECPDSDFLYKESKTEADARALMLIWLIENKHVDAKELN